MTATADPVTEILDALIAYYVAAEGVHEIEELAHEDTYFLHGIHPHVGINPRAAIELGELLMAWGKARTP